LSRDAAQLERVLQLLLDESQQKSLAKEAGRRLPGRPQPAAQLAGLLPRQPKLAEKVAAAVARACAAQSGLAEATNGAPLLDLGQWLGDPNHQEALLADCLAACATLDTAEERRPATTARPENQTAEATISQDRDQGKGKAAKSPSPKEKLVRDNRRLKEQLAQLRRVLAERQEEAGTLRRELQQEEDLHEQAEAARRDAELRASERKKQLRNAISSSDREDQLEAVLESLRRELNIEKQKRQMVAEESDDLRACLEDRDRFDAVEEEEVPSFRQRPLLDRECTLSEELTARRQAGQSYRILVVGGGEPQFRHRDKLEEYAEVMGFQSSWRMAEYTSWHKEMDRLATDMNTRYDALIILHWNRTTFTRRARLVCDTAGHKPCITCYYEGFTSLRETMQLCLRQLLDRGQDKAVG